VAGWQTAGQLKGGADQRCCLLKVLAERSRTIRTQDLRSCCGVGSLISRTTIGRIEFETCHHAHLGIHVKKPSKCRAF
jgi:hypothetical protein